MNRLPLALVAAVLVAGCATPPAPDAPPAPRTPEQVARPAGPYALVNAGFESTAPGRRNDPEGWFTFQHAGDVSYKFSLDTDSPHGGLRSLRIDNVGPEPYGAIAQVVEARYFAGKVARYSAWVRTRDVTGAGGGITILALANGAPLAQNFMEATPIKGTTGWTRYTITLPVPPRAERLEFGAMLQGPGSLWLDDTELEFTNP